MPVLERRVGSMDPYRNYRFRIAFDGRIVAGVSKVSALKRAAAPEGVPSPAHGLGKIPNPGRSKFDAVTLERGVTSDPDFEAWARSVHDVGAASASTRSARKDLELQTVDESGRVVRTVKLVACWISEYQAVPNLDAGANGILIETMKVENEGWTDDGK